ncbi:tectonic-1 isoform X2 [Hyperolius riggenbachi]|uniref:tectonic-1 isoform X2 n=1 Tax=Hyperolius riggenbachi TaxID=752182 RepID=UPI0035A38868
MPLPRLCVLLLAVCVARVSAELSGIEQPDNETEVWELLAGGANRTQVGTKVTVPPLQPGTEQNTEPPPLQPGTEQYKEPPQPGTGQHTEPPLLQPGTEQNTEPPPLQPGTEQYKEPPQPGTGQHTEPPLLQPGTEQNTEPPPLQPGTEQYKEPPQPGTGQHTEPPLLQPGTNQYISPPSLQPGTRQYTELPSILPGTEQYTVSPPLEPGTEQQYTLPSSLQPGTDEYTAPPSLQPAIPDLTDSYSESPELFTVDQPPILVGDEEILDFRQTRSIPVLVTSASNLCVCDLLVSQCDVNCCCDPDCTTADFSVFSECSISVVTGDSQLCTQDAVLYSLNASQASQRVTQTVQLVNPNVFCIQTTNYQPALSYITPDEPTEANFDNLLKEFGGSQFNIVNSGQNTVGSAEARNSTRYEYGSPILTQNSYLKLPAALGTGICTDNNPVGFLQEQAFMCTRVIQVARCSIPALTLGTYTGVQILPVPNSQHGINVTVQTITVQSVDGAAVRGNISDSTPSYNSSTGICTNVVLGGNYSIIYTDKGEITNVLASFTLGAINSNTIQQVFHINFTESTDRFGRLTLLQSSSQQDCLTEEGRRAAVLFGYNMMSGCKLRLNYNDTAFCQLAADITLNALKGQQFPGYVAQFGNSKPENVLDWVTINTVSSVAQSSSQTSSTICSIPVSLELEVWWTKFGSLINPQAQIVNVTEKITYAVIPSNLGSGHAVQISTAVSFVDVAQAASPGYRAQPTIDAKLPFDFFLPFV